MPAGKPPPPASPASVPPSADDDLDDLPPIDGDDDEAEAQPDEELDDDEAKDAGGDPLDDSTGEGDPVDDDLDIGGDESGWLDDAGDAEQLDVGTPETFGEEEGAALLEGADEPDAEEEEDLGIGEEGASLVDSGEEGFEDEEEELREEDLSRLDSGPDEDGELDDAEVSESLPEDDLVEEPRPPWADRAWERAEGDVSGLAAVDALCWTPDGVIVGGQGLARIGGNGAVTVLEALGMRGGAPSAITAEGPWVVLATPRAGVLTSSDGGRAFAEANGWRASVAPGDAIVDLVVAAGELWGRTRGGALVWSGDRAATWRRVASDKRIEGLAPDGAGSVVAVARDGAACVVSRGRGGELAEAARAPIPAGAVVGVAADHERVAIGVAGRGAFRVEGGEATRLEGTASLTAVAVGPGGALLVALASDAEARAWIALAHAGVPARVVAEIDAPKDGARADDEDAARVRAMAWDQRAGVLWAAGAFGLAALRPSRR